MLYWIIKTARVLMVVLMLVTIYVSITQAQAAEMETEASRGCGRLCGKHIKGKPTRRP